MYNKSLSKILDYTSVVSKILQGETEQILLLKETTDV